MDKVQAFGKDFSWEKPESCPSCGGIRLWGHGFVLRYFCGFPQGLWLKRYRCPDCGAVHTVRPVEFSPGFHYPWKKIQASLDQKMRGGIFQKNTSRQCQQYWLKAYRFQVYRKGNFPSHMAAPKSQRMVTFRLNYREIIYFATSPYLPFAVTTQPLRI